MYHLEGPQSEYHKVVRSHSSDKYTLFFSFIKASY